MRKLLYVSIPFLMMGCGTSEDSIQIENEQDSTLTVVDSSLILIDLPLTDSVKPIIHGTPDPEKLDSIKKSKDEKKKKG